MATATSSGIPPISPKGRVDSSRGRNVRSPPPRRISTGTTESAAPQTPTRSGVVCLSSDLQPAGIASWKRRVTVSPPQDSKRNRDDTEATMEESNDLEDVLKSPVLKDSPVVPEEEIHVMEITEFHECIACQDWTHLEKALKKFNRRYYKRQQEKVERRKEQRSLQQQLQGETLRSAEVGDNDSAKSPPKSPSSDSTNHLPQSPSPSTRGRMLKFLPQSLSRGKHMNNPGNVIISPLLKVDEQGRTPLHLACVYGCPEELFVTLLREDRKATSKVDSHGQLPLHLAVTSRMHDHVLEKIVKAHPNALKTKDLQSRTPVGVAVEMARDAQENVQDKGNIEDPDRPFSWATPLNKREGAWQFDQARLWSKVDFLLKDLMRRNRCVIPSEHGLLIEALEAGAPPKVINRFISTTDKYLKNDDDFAGNALAMCVERQYNLDTLEYLIESCRDGTTMITDYTQKAMVAHYRRGCHPLVPGMAAFGKEIIDWCKLNQNANDGNKEGSGKAGFLDGASTQCLEWWRILRHLLFFAAYGKDSANKEDQIQDMHMLHAALAVPAAQPSLIQLLMLIFPEAQLELCPSFKALPVHLACTRWRYDVLRNDKDSSMEKVLKVFLKTDREQLVRRHKGRLPLHMALITGQSWSFVKPFVSLDKPSVGMRDPHTKLFPFQLAAIKISSRNLAMLLRNQYTPGEWRNLSQAEKKAEFDRARDLQDRRQICTVYELLRRHPDAIRGKYLVRDSVKVVIDVQGAGLVSSHYLALAYQRGATGWRLNQKNVISLRDSIVNGHVAMSLMLWWDRLRGFIWQSNPSGAIPANDEYLLHAALYNPDTPPTIVELLISLYPMAVTRPIPGTQVYPLHIAAGTAAYHPQSFEVPYSFDNMQLVLNAYRGATRLSVNGQLPIHMCLSRGKTWKDVCPLVKHDKKTLLMEDPVSKLAPFELMAAFKITSTNNILRFASVAEKQTRNSEMDKLSVADRAKLLRDVKRNFDLELLSTIYELLRGAPTVLKTRIPRGTNDATSSVSLDNADEFESKQPLPGNMASMEEYLHAVEKTQILAQRESLSSYLGDGAPQGAINGYVSPGPQKISSLASFLDGSPASSGPEPNPSLSRCLGGRGMWGREASARPLISRNSGAFSLDGSYVRPEYDDDGAESMEASVASSFVRSPKPNDGSAYSSTTPSSSVRRMPKGQSKNRNRLPNLPDLEKDA